MNFTVEQQQAIDLEGQNIIVSAGAGSGKTAVLTERVLRKIRSGTSLERLLILTFTKAAAGEMKERIRKKLYASGLKEALAQLDSSYITTFDSFALSVVKKYHVELGLPKEISITEDAVLTLERTRILEEMFEELYQEENEQFLTLLSSFALKDDKTLKGYVLGLHDAIEQVLDKDDLFINYEEKYYSTEHLDSLVKAYLEKINQKQQAILETTKSLLSETESTFQEKLSIVLEPLLNSLDYDTLKKHLEIKLPSLPRGSDEDVKKLKKQLSLLIKDLRELCSYEDEASIKEELLDTKENNLLLLEIVRELDMRFTNFKRQENLFNFMDIARLAISAVKNYPTIQEEMKASFDEIMVDEYQDTNDIQEAFLSYIAQDNIYMVGDMKQSIYRFRNANPLIFKNKYDHYKKNDGGVAIDLSRNFRSREEVLEDINLLFSKLMDDKFGGVTYNDGHAMIYGNHLYDSEKQNSNYFLEIYTYQKQDEFSNYEQEIFIIGQDIQNKIKAGYQVVDKDKGSLRPVKYSDFAILLDRSKYFDSYKKVFEYLGIPLAIKKEDKLSSEIDLALIHNMFLLLDCICRDDYHATFRHAFTSLARSFLYQIDDKEIYTQLLTHTFYQSQVYQDFLTFKELYEITTPSELLILFLEKTNYEEKLVTQGKVSIFRKRMEYLYHLAFSLEKIGKTNVDFLNLLSDLVKEGIEVGVSYQQEDGDAVQLMSIHKSKGLEFPICYFADFHHPFNFQDLKNKIKFHHHYGILLPQITNDEENKTICERLLRDEVEEEEISERIRLFYVALTRAREKMIVVSLEQQEEERITSKREALSFEKMLSYLYSSWQSKETKIVEIPMLSHDYLVPKTLKNLDIQEEITPYFFEKEEPIEKIEASHFSKSMLLPLTKEEQENVELGLLMHSVFEQLDFDNPQYEKFNLSPFLKKSIQTFIESGFIKQNKNAKMYREYEFLEEIDNIMYHGIIDLLLIKEKEAIILDYKLKHVEDKAYDDQILGYKKVIEKRTGLPTKTYLYSILDQKLQEIFDK